jgi:hypothetical protein
MTKASFVTLACYDWRLLPTSIAAYHDAADEVLIGLDYDRRTWSGTPFECDRSALEYALRDFPKCRIVEDQFSLGRKPLENDCAEREYLARLTRNPWVVEVDADEIVDGAAIVRALSDVPRGRQLFGLWKDVLKVDGDTALLRDTSSGGRLCALATRSRTRRYARETGEPIYVAPIEVEHLTTARPEPELRQKFAGWGHSDTCPNDALDKWRELSARSPSVVAVPVSSLRWSSHIA